jgi:hypothetical protein
MKKQQILGFIRHLIGLAGGALIAQGIGDEALITETTGALMGLISIIWSWAEKSSR